KHRAVAKLVIEYGHAVPINDDAKEKRKKLGLEEMPYTVQRFPESLDEVHKLIKITKFDELTTE
ncbi:MAG: CoB--CoM heterodisulfide reductase subunit C, partial [Euryarchaeota archaeon]|nr:CoB--CoM heterodisulfide reductase subunit C [Euryarchaeota archaeon]